MFCFHKFGKWSELVNAHSGVYQYRVCEKCGVIEKSKRGWNNDFNLLMWNKKEEEKDER